jgi:hypothetical protein
MKKNHILLFSLLLLFLAELIYGCKKDDVEEESLVTSDQSLYDKVKNNQFAYYQDNNILLQPAGGSPHGTFKLRFNATAQSVLGPDGKLPTNGVFPDSSILLKEVYNGNVLTLLVPMMKLSRDKNSGSRWVWAEYNPDGSVVYSISNKGQGCIPCHSSSPNRDLTRSFDLH